MRYRFIDVRSSACTVDRVTPGSRQNRVSVERTATQCASRARFARDVPALIALPLSESWDFANTDYERRRTRRAMAHGCALQRAALLVISVSVRTGGNEVVAAEELVDERLATRAHFPQVRT